MLEDENLIAHNHTDEGDESEDGGETYGTSHEPEAEEGAGEHEQDGYHAGDGELILAEVEEDEEEYDDECYDEA